jgi:hypothetical protein
VSCRARETPSYHQLASLPIAIVFAFITFVLTSITSVTTTSAATLTTSLARHQELVLVDEPLRGLRSSIQLGEPHAHGEDIPQQLEGVLLGRLLAAVPHAYEALVVGEAVPGPVQRLKGVAVVVEDGELEGGELIVGVPDGHVAEGRDQVVAVADDGAREVLE